MKAFVKKLQQVNELLDGTSLRQITTRVANQAKTVAIPAISPATLSHWGKGGKKGGYVVKARYEVKSNSQAVIQPTIPPLAALLEEGSGSKWAAPRKRGSKRRRKGTVGSYTRTPVPARHAWSKVVAPIAAVVPRTVDEEVRKVLGRVF
jgi:hypothetical protein